MLTVDPFCTFEPAEGLWAITLPELPESQEETEVTVPDSPMLWRSAIASDCVRP